MSEWYWWGVGVSVVLENLVLLWMVFGLLPKLLNRDSVMLTWMQEQIETAKPPVAAGTSAVLTDRELAQRERMMHEASRQRAQVVQTGDLLKSVHRSRPGYTGLR